LGFLHNEFFEFAPDGQSFAVIRSDKTVRIWNLETRTETSVIQVQGEGKVLCVAYSPDGLRFATGSTDKSAVLWDIARGQRVKTFPGHAGTVRSLAFSRDGKLLATGISDGTVQLWDIAGGRKFPLLKGHKSEEGVLGLAFSPDGSILATAGFDRTMILWDVISQKQRVLTAHNAPIGDLVFSRDGRTIATSDWVGVTRLWNVETEQEIATFRGRVVAFSPDDKVLAIGERVASAGGVSEKTSRVTLYRAPPLQEITAREAAVTTVAPGRVTR
jgi:WD40 repeat protein